MAKLHEGIAISARSAEVWAPGGVAAWVPALSSSHLDGEYRTSTLVVGPLPLRAYRARFSVNQRGNR
jgi:hypothetical protein